MGIKTETFDTNHVRTFSDAGRYVVHDGASFVEAVDPVGSGREYFEGEIIFICEEPDGRR